ncbi:MAG: DUF3592 domain-containing protein [Gammaproteobacteria bacterium]|nr:DUF3592 domain-containing protein [Gammaproteobacteria bacterium]
MKAILWIVIIIFSASLISCKPAEIGEQNCKVVIQELDQCNEFRTKGLFCDIAIDNIKRSFKQTSINEYNRAMWATHCKVICSNSFEYSPALRQNYEKVCMDSEIFNVKDKRLIGLTTLSLMWLIGCVAFLFSLRSFFRVRQFRMNSIKTTGVVVDHEKHYGYRQDTYAPVIEFKDWVGRAHRFTSGTSTSVMGKPGNPLNSAVKIIYPKDHPEKARQDSLMSLWLLPLFLFFWGGGFVFMAGFGLFSTNEWRNHNEYLQQHTPVIAKTVDTLVHTMRGFMPVLTTIKDYRFTDEKSNSLIIEVDYNLSPFERGEIYMSAITMTNGQSGGEWTFWPARLQNGSGKAQVKLGVANNAPDHYCSNEIKFSIYSGGESNFYERVIPYEKCWSK